MPRLPFFHSNNKPASSEVSPTPSHLRVVEDVHPPAADELLSQAFDADNQKDALEAIQQIPDIDAAKRIQASVDIYLTFQEAMNKTDLETLRASITQDILEFSGERLPNDIAEQVGIPEEFIEETKLTGVVDYIDVQAAIKVWDEVSRSNSIATILAAFIDQYREASSSNEREAALLGEAFYRSLEDGSKVFSNERRLLRRLQSTGSSNHFNDDERQDEILRIAAERDRERKIQRELGARAAR